MMNNLVTLRTKCPDCGHRETLALTLTQVGNVVVCGRCIRCGYQVRAEAL